MSAPGDKAEDIVQRLHKIAGQYDECDWHGAIELEAADEITRLRAEVARLRDALDLIASICAAPPYVPDKTIQKIADEALGNFDALQAEAAKPRGSLLREPLAHAPPGCHCTDTCAAPVVQGRQTPCRDPEKAARFAKAGG